MEDFASIKINPQKLQTSFLQSVKIEPTTILIVTVTLLVIPQFDCHSAAKRRNLLFGMA